MKIELISSKKIKVGDNFYESDSVISSDGEVFEWEREASRLTERDVQSLLKKDPDLIIVSKNKEFKGISHSHSQLLKDKDVTLVTDELFEAVNVFNKAIKTKKDVLIVLPLG